MPRSQTNPKRAGHVRRYALKDAHYRRVLAYWAADHALAPELHRQRDRPRPEPLRAGWRMPRVKKPAKLRIAIES